MPALAKLSDLKPTQTCLALGERIIYQAPSSGSQDTKKRLFSGQMAYVLDTLHVVENGHDYLFAQLQPTPGTSVPEYIIAAQDNTYFVVLRPLSLDPSSISQVLTMLVSTLDDLKQLVARLGK